MLKKKFFNWAVVPMVAAMAFVGLNSFTGDGESSSGKWEAKTKKCYKTVDGKRVEGESDCTRCFSGTATYCYPGSCYNTDYVCPASSEF